MRVGFVLPYGAAPLAATAAAEAEEAGWDGFFVWDAVWSSDPWVCLTAAAMVTDRIELGTMLTPLSRRRPWKVASETATLDDLCRGRLILATGLGAVDTGFAEFGEETDRRVRAELLDESLEIITGLWAGQPYSFAGRHYTVEPIDFLPPPRPARRPRIPIWIVGAWPSAPSMDRVARFDGWLPYVKGGGELFPDHVAAGCTYLVEKRGEPIDIVVEGSTDPTSAADAATVGTWRDAGATWWLETMWATRDDDAAVISRIRRGPVPV